MTKPIIATPVILPTTTPMATLMQAKPSPGRDHLDQAERVQRSASTEPAGVQTIANERQSGPESEYETDAGFGRRAKHDSHSGAIEATAALQESDTAPDGRSAVDASRPSGPPAVRQAVKLSRFWTIEPCDCCGRRVPRNRSWRSTVCTPSCWAALTPDDRSRLMPEPAPCLVCQDRLAERRRTSSHVRALVGGDGGGAGTVPGVGGLGPRVGNVSALSGEAA